MGRFYACVGALLEEAVRAALTDTGFELAPFEADLPATGEEPALVVVTAAKQAGLSYRGPRLLILARHGEAARPFNGCQSELCIDCVTPNAFALGLRALLHGLVVRSPCRPSTTRAAIELAELTPRQREIVSMLLGGAQVKEIARQLDLSPSTVRFHLEEARERIGADSLLHMVLRVAGLEGTPPR